MKRRRTAVTRDGAREPARAARAAGAAGPAAADPLRQARPAPLHQPPRLQPGLRAGGVPGPGADGLLLGLQPAPADLLRRRRADRVRQRGGVPRDRAGRGRRPRRGPRVAAPRRCPTGSTSSRWSSRRAGALADLLEASRWRVEVAGARARPRAAVAERSCAADDGPGGADDQEGAARLRLPRGRRLAGRRAAAGRRRRACSTWCCGTPCPPCAPTTCSPGWPRVAELRRRAAHRC